MIKLINNCLIHFYSKLIWKMTFDGTWPSMEDDLQFKMTFDGRWPSIEDTLWWKMNIKGRRPSMKDDLRWKTPFDGRWPLMEDDLCWKTTFDGRQPSMGYDLRWYGILIYVSHLGSSLLPSWARPQVWHRNKDAIHDWNSMVMVPGLWDSNWNFFPSGCPSCQDVLHNFWRWKNQSYPLALIFIHILTYLKEELAWIHWERLLIATSTWGIFIVSLYKNYLTEVWQSAISKLLLLKAAATLETSLEANCHRQADRQTEKATYRGTSLCFAQKGPDQDISALCAPGDPGS